MLTEVDVKGNGCTEKNCKNIFISGLVPLSLSHVCDPGLLTGL